MAADKPPASEGRPRPRLLAIQQAITPRRAARLIAGATLLLTLAGGVAARLIDRDDFNSLNDSLWWALQTVTTVGYGDVVPRETTGRLIGALLMLNGIALITVVSASVTAMLIEQARQRRPASPSEEKLLAKLERIELRLAEIEAGTPRRGQDTGDD